MSRLPPRFNRVYEYSNSSMLQFADALCPFLSRLNCTGGNDIIEVTLTELYSLINTSSLLPGSMYKVTGVNKNKTSGGPSNPNGLLPEVLYDDGTNSGITAYAQALTSTQLSSNAYGEFYNPKYKPFADYSNTDGTGLYGIWDGDNPDPADVPAYVVGDVVFWGGYAWENISGLVGNKIDPFNLSDTDWVKLPYSNTTYYNQVIDLIQVDWLGDIVVNRYNPENEIFVQFAPETYSYLNGLSGSTVIFTVSPISRVGWGLYSIVSQDTSPFPDFGGIGDIWAKDAVVECVNFKGILFANIHADDSILVDNYIGINCYFYELSLHSFAFFGSNISKNAEAYRLELKGSVFSSNTLIESSFYTCTLINTSAIQGCYISENSTVKFNTLDESTVNTVTILGASEFSSNFLKGSTISFSYFDVTTSVEHNSFFSDSRIQASTFTNIEFRYNDFINGKWLFADLNNTDMQSCVLNNTTFNGCIIPINTALNNINFQGPLNIVGVDLTPATHIFFNCSKQVFIRKDGTVRLSYYDNSDTIGIYNITA